MELPSIPDLDLPNNLRLGHLAEKVVAGLIKASTNYTLLRENIQIIQGNDTVGELDFIVQEASTKAVTHVELAYKFYLFDPSRSENPLAGWIGPNRNDSLAEKLNKLKLKQLPLLYHASAKTLFPEVEISQVSQALCLLATLYIPCGYSRSFGESITKAIKGYYLTFGKFKTLNTIRKGYYIPSKKEWGIEPATNKQWAPLEEVEPIISSQIAEKRAVLIWQKNQKEYTSFFITWW